MIPCYPWGNRYRKWSYLPRLPNCELNLPWVHALESWPVQGQGLPENLWQGRWRKEHCSLLFRCGQWQGLCLMQSAPEWSQDTGTEPWRRLWGPGSSCAWRWPYLWLVQLPESKISLWGPEIFWARSWLIKGTDSPHPSPRTYFGGDSVSLVLLDISFSGFFTLPSFLGWKNDLEEQRVGCGKVNDNRTNNPANTHHIPQLPMPVPVPGRNRRLQTTPLDQ